MSKYGQQVIEMLMSKLKDEEVVTIDVMGCNREVMKYKCKVFSGNNFEKLNEEVATFADCLVIVEGGKKSGTMLLAQNFVEKNKPVYAVPGRITDEGSWTPNWLIEQGAIPLTDIMMICGGQ